MWQTFLHQQRSELFRIWGLVFLGMTGYCYLHGILSAEQGEPDILVSAGWAYSRLLFWVLITPLVFRILSDSKRIKSSVHRVFFPVLIAILTVLAGIAAEMLLYTRAISDPLYTLYQFLPFNIAAMGLLFVMTYWFTQAPEAPQKSSEIKQPNSSPKLSNCDARILVSQGRNEVMVDLKDIEFIKASGNYVELIKAQSTFLLRATLSQLEDRLGQLAFVRVHRKYLINTEAIASFSGLNSKKPVVTTKTGLSLPVGPTYKDIITRHREVLNATSY